MITPKAQTLYNEPSITRTLLGPQKAVLYIHGGVPIWDGLQVHVSKQVVSNVAEQWCTIEGGGCTSEVSFSRAAHNIGNDNETLHYQIDIIQQ